MPQACPTFCKRQRPAERRFRHELHSAPRSCRLEPPRGRTRGTPALLLQDHYRARLSPPATTGPVEAAGWAQQAPCPAPAASLSVGTASSALSCAHGIEARALTANANVTSQGSRAASESRSSEWGPCRAAQVLAKGHHRSFCQFWSTFPLRQLCCERR